MTRIVVTLADGAPFEDLVQAIMAVREALSHPEVATRGDVPIYLNWSIQDVRVEDDRLDEMQALALELGIDLT